MTRPSVVKVMLLAALLVSPGVVQQLQFEAPPKAAAGRSALPAKPIPGAELLAELHKGGYVIYFRHTSTDFSRDDSRSQSDDDCANQRPLTDRGREEARQIGAALRELKIPVGKVLASPRCRTLKTAMLAFGRAEKSPEARGGPVDPVRGRASNGVDASNPERYAGLHRLLSTEIKPGANLAIASHGNPFYAVAGPPYLAEGEAAVIRPLGNDFEIIARVRHDAWRTLTRNQ